MPDLNQTKRSTRAALFGAAALIAVGGAFGASNIVAFSPAQAQAPAAQTMQAMPSFADVIERVRGAVVSVKVTSRTVADSGDAREYFGRGMPGLPDEQLERFFRQFRGDGQPGSRGGRGGRTASQGSGFIISADGYVVTNNHVVRDGAEVSLVLDDGRTVAASVVGADEKTDLALLKIKDAGTYKFVNFADSLPRVGDWVVAIGNPFGLGGTVTAGIVSARGRDIGAGPYDDFLQIDAPVNRGNSGGPTFDMNGNVAGVNTAIYSPSGGSVGIGFAIPSTVAKNVIASLRENGSVSRGYLGVQIQPVTPEVAQSLKLPNANGALIAEAQPGTPAANAGLRSGDVIVAVNGERIANPRELSRKIALLGPTRKAEVTYSREGAEKTVSVTLASQPNERQASLAGRGAGREDDRRSFGREDDRRNFGRNDDREPRSRLAPDADREGGRFGDRSGSQGDRSGSASGDRYGMSLAPASAVAGGGGEGVVVAEIDPDGAAARQGVRSGDVILEAGGRKVSTPEEVSRAIADARRAGNRAVMLRIKSGEGSRFVALTTRPS